MKLVLIITGLVIFPVQNLLAGIGFGQVRKRSLESINGNPPNSAIERDLVHQKLKRSAFIRANPSRTRLNSSKQNQQLICHTNANCASVDKSYELLSAQVGLQYQDKDLGMIFFPVHGEKTQQINTGESTQYGSDIWVSEQKFFYIKVSENSPILPLQVDFNGDNIEGCDNCKAYLVTNFYYRQSGVDYSDYLDGASRSQLEVVVDSENDVVDHTVIVYDDDDNILEQRKLSAGDQIQVVYTGDKYQDTKNEYLYVLENFIEVTQSPQFSYDFAIPGEDFFCTHCDRNFAQMDLYFRLQGINFDVQGVESEIHRTSLQYLGTAENIKRNSNDSKTQISPTLETLSTDFNSLSTITNLKQQTSFELIPGLIIPLDQHGKQAIYFGSAFYQGRYYPLASKQVTLSEKISQSLFDGTLGDLTGSIDIIQEYILLDAPSQRYGNAFRMEVNGD